MEQFKKSLAWGQFNWRWLLGGLWPKTFTFRPGCSEHWPGKLHKPPRTGIFLHLWVSVPEFDHTHCGRKYFSFHLCKYSMLQLVYGASSFCRVCPRRVCICVLSVSVFLDRRRQQFDPPLPSLTWMNLLLVSSHSSCALTQSCLPLAGHVPVVSWAERLKAGSSIQMGSCRYKLAPSDLLAVVLPPSNSDPTIFMQITDNRIQLFNPFSCCGSGTLGQRDKICKAVLGVFKPLYPLFIHSATILNVPKFNFKLSAQYLSFKSV